MANSITNPVRRVRLPHRKWPLMVAMLGASVLAQVAPPTPSASASVAPVAGTGAAPSEALQRQALGPYRMILRNAAAPSKVKSATAPTAAAPRQSSPKQTPDTSAPASPVEPTPVPTVAATPITTPTVQAVEAAAPAAQAPTPITASVAAPTPMPPPVRAKTALVLIRNDPPALSGPLARESPTGVVRVAFNVNPDGSISDAKIAASNNRRLNSAVLAAITKWRYQPIDAAQATEVEMVFSND